MAAVTTWSGPERPASKRASHALAVHEPQQRSFPGHREALGRAPPGGYQSQHGYDPDALVATPHLPVEAALQDHEGSHFSLGIRRDVSGTEPTNMASSLIQGHAEHRTRMRNNVPQPPGSCCHHRPDRYHTGMRRPAHQREPSSAEVSDGRGRLQDWPSTPLSNPLVAAEASVEPPCGYEPSAWEGLTKRLAKSHALTFAAQCHHGGHQVQQWPSEPHALDLRLHGPHALLGGTTGAGKSELRVTSRVDLAWIAAGREARPSARQLKELHIASSRRGALYLKRWSLAGTHY